MLMGLVPDPIPSTETYRGVALHCEQSERRLRVVRNEIDHVIDGLRTAAELQDYAANPRNAPESRTAAAALAIALYDLATEERRERPKVDRVLMECFIVGCNAKGWQSPDWYGNITERGCAPRETPLFCE